MPSMTELKSALKDDRAKSVFEKLYGSEMVGAQRLRYDSLLDRFGLSFPGFTDVGLFSTPGRTEVCGNHTDHNGGRVLAGAVNLDAVAAASKTDDDTIIIASEGYPEDTVDLRNLSPLDEEKHTSAALIRGIAARLSELGYTIGGFRAVTTSSVLKGSGLSSSAAFEVLVVTILNHLYNGGRVSDMTAAQVSQYAENTFFGKPCGLMDQTTCAYGGFVTIDFKDFADPLVRKVSFDFASCGHSLVIVDTGGNHADLTEDYAAVAAEMRAAAQILGGRVLRDSDKPALLSCLKGVREAAGDRAVLRALHFFDDDERVGREVRSLESGDFPGFLSLVRESGMSSWTLLQNCYTTRNPGEQGIPLALALSAEILGSRGAFRVHGGGFAGTIQAYVPKDLLDSFLAAMRGVFGESSCHVLMVRPMGTAQISFS